MSNLSVPEGYVPYRLFEYDDGAMSCTLRPEQYVGATLLRDYQAVIQPVFWNVKVTLRDGEMTLPLGVGAEAQTRGRRFLADLRDFIHADALRNTHNAVMRKGKTHD